MKITCNLVITKENQNDFKNLVECRDITVQTGCVFVAKKLQTSGYIDLREPSKGSFPALQTSGNIYLREHSKGSFPALQTSGNIDLMEHSKGCFPALQTSGNIYLRKHSKGSFPALQTSGNIDLMEHSKGSFPALQTSGNIDLMEHSKGSFPALQTSGNIYLRENSKGSFPALQTSGNIYLRENSNLDHPKIKNLNYKSVDRTLFVIENEKATKGIKILTGYVVERIINNTLQKRNCFVAEKQGFFAHGETVKKAIGDLNFKIVAEKLKHDPIKENTLFTVKYYRLLTGACDSGCRSFMAQNNIPYKIVGDNETVELKPITAKDLLPILEKNHAYGFEKFKSLLTF